MEKGAENKDTKAVIAAFLFHAGDVGKLHDLLRFISELGGAKNHAALLVADAATPFDACRKAKELALKSFGEVRCISNGKSTTGWPQGPNSLFWAAAQYIEWSWHKPWLLLETDCVPLKANWLDAIEAEYKGLDTFMGDVYQGLASDTGLPMRAFSGVAVYPPSAATRLINDPTKPWDMANRETLLKDGVPTPLIKHFYGEKNFPPTFIATRDTNAPRNAFTLAQIRPQAVLFHRNKDGSLMRVLREYMGIHTPSRRILVCYTVAAFKPDNEVLAVRFMRSYDQFPAGTDHTVVVICNGGAPPPWTKTVFPPHFTIYPRSNDGWDIGGYLEIAQSTIADLVLCLGESVYFHKAGWLKRLEDAWLEYGPGFYGIYSSNLIRPHLPTTAFACSTSYLKSYPKVVGRKDRYIFEHGTNACWKRVQEAKGAVKLVTWSGAWDQPDWRKVKNIMWNGDQSDCLVFSNHTDRYLNGTPLAKQQLEEGATTGVTKPPTFSAKVGEIMA